mgnify:CR=1 FL=1
MKVKLINASKIFNDEQKGVINEFIKFIQSQLPLKKDVQITFLERREQPMTTGVRLPHHDIRVLAGKRLLQDVLRTFAHEWVHEYQHQKLGLAELTPTKDIGGKVENMANALGGVMVKKFERDFPQFENILYDEDSQSLPKDK